MPNDRWIVGPVTTDLPANGPREFYQPARLHTDGSIEPLTWKGSADVFTLAQANALLVRSENESAANRGTTVRALRLL
ncbi:MAG: hypothetical protein QM770_04370 [Tepidisphaeraceae bacterium]